MICGAGTPGDQLAGAPVQSAPFLRSVKPLGAGSVEGRLLSVRICEQTPSGSAQTCGTVEFSSSIFRGLDCAGSPPPPPPPLRPTSSTTRGHPTILRSWCNFRQREEVKNDDPVLFFLPRDDVLFRREALLHDRVSGRQREPPASRGPHPADGVELLQPDHRCLNERLPGSGDQASLPGSGAGVPGDGEPPVPHRGPAPARRLPPTASALLRHATPGPAQLLPLGVTEQIFWTQVSRYGKEEEMERHRAEVKDVGATCTISSSLPGVCCVNVLTWEGIFS